LNKAYPELGAEEVINPYYVSENGRCKMKKKKSLLVIILAMALAAVTADLASRGSQSADVILGNALHQEEVEGNYEAAIETYKKLLAQFPDNRPLAAQAQLRIGMCYEKLGHAEAVKAYELVLQKYGDQSEQVAAAQARLAALRVETPGGLTVTKIELPESQHFEVHALSPDGTKMAGLVFGEGQNIAVYDLATRRVEPVTHLDWSRVTENAIWSPDGKEIVYLQIGSGGLPDNKEGLIENLFLMVSSLDGKARPIFSKKDSLPIPLDWLPDGSAVVACLVVAPGVEGVEGMDLGLVPATGGAFKTLHPMKGDFHSGHAFADVSPDGRHIAFADGPKLDEQNIYCISTDGQSVQVLTDHSANDIQPRWSPDGKYVVFMSFRSGTKALWGIKVENGMPAGDPFVIKEMERGTNLLNWTARGLAYKNSLDMWDIYMVTVDPETGEPVGKLEQLDYFPSGFNKTAVWSPDGRLLAFFSADSSGQPGQGNIVIMAVEEGQAHEYKIPMDTFSLPFVGGLRWMPDSSGLGFFGPGKKGATLFRFTLASEKWKTWDIRAPGWGRIEWCASGKAFLYPKGNLGIFERDLETGEERSIYRPENEKKVISLLKDMRFSRDYKNLVFHRSDIKFESNETEELRENFVVVDMVTGEARMIESEVFDDLFWSAGWSPDGKNLAVLNKVGEKPSELLIVPLEEGTPNKVELIGGPINADCYITDWSHDGKHIAFEIRHITYEIFVMKNIIPKK
jgi:Tol biopolymer transport system component